MSELTNHSASFLQNRFFIFMPICRVGFVGLSGIRSLLYDACAYRFVLLLLHYVVLLCYVRCCVLCCRVIVVSLCCWLCSCVIVLLCHLCIVVSLCCVVVLLCGCIVVVVLLRRCGVASLWCCDVVYCNSVVCCLVFIVLSQHFHSRCASHCAVGLNFSSYCYRINFIDNYLQTT